MGTKMHPRTGRLSLVLHGSVLPTCGRVDDVDPLGRGHRIVEKNCGQPAALQFRSCGSQRAGNRHDAWAGPDSCQWIAIPIVARYIPRRDRYGGIFVKRDANPNFLNGVPELLVLQLLKGREMYGYELVQAIKEATGETIVLGEGVVYPVLHMLEREGALQSRRQSVSGRSRIYYSLTPTGESRLTDVSGSWQRMAECYFRRVGYSLYLG